MHRRRFIALSALTAPLAAANPATPEQKWWETVEETLRFTARSDEGDLTLEVELTKPPEDALTEAINKEGIVTGYLLAGERLPERFWPGCSLLTKFAFRWDGKAMGIPERLWRDLAGLRIRTSSLKPESVDGELQWKLEQFLAGLEQPRVSLSADGGTALIEWVRPEECDGRSTIRWIISRSGAVLRHRYTPPHEC